MVLPKEKPSRAPVTLLEVSAPDKLPTKQLKALTCVLAPSLRGGEVAWGDPVGSGDLMPSHVTYATALARRAEGRVINVNIPLLELLEGSTCGNANQNPSDAWL